MSVFSVNFCCWLFVVEYAANGSLYNFLQLPRSEQLTFENTVQWAKDIARGTFCHTLSASVVSLRIALHSSVILFDPVAQFPEHLKIFLG